jgi:hypothetical protein
VLFTYLQRTTGMSAAARDLHRSFRVLATLAAVSLVIGYDAPAGRMRTFLLLSLSHGEYPFFPNAWDRLVVALPDFGIPPA